jgi:peptide/nickel transport system substrate-binding protein
MAYFIPVLRRPVTRCLFWSIIATSAAPLALASLKAKPASVAIKGGTLTIGLIRQAECLDPQQSNYGYGAVEGRQIADSLTEQSYQDPTKIVPWLAKSWEIEDNASTYVFHLRNDVTFSDGTKFTAQVVKDNFEKLAQIPSAAGAAYLQGIKSIVAEDPETLRISFSQPNAPFLQATATPELSILAEATLQKTPDQRCAGGVIGSGPFVLQSVTFNEREVLTKRKGYNWASSLRSHQGEAYLDKVVYRIIPEANVRTGALKSGQVDVVQTVSDQDVDSLRAAGFDVVTAYSAGNVITLVINTSRPILSDKRVRLALQHAINRQEVVNLAYDGHQPAAAGLMTRVSPDFLDQRDKLSYDPALSRKLLDASGWRLGPDGIRVKDGKPLVLTVTYHTNPTNQAFLEVIQEEVRDVGIDLRLRPLNSGAFDATLLAGDYDMHRWAWPLGDPNVLRTVYSTETLNRFRLSPGNKLDVLLDEQRALADPIARKKAVDEAQSLILDEAYGLPIFDGVGLWGESKKVNDIEYTPGYPTQVLYDAWVSR